MYRKKTSNWIKHLDFLIIDLLCVEISLFLSYAIRHGWENLYANTLYRNMSLMLVFIDVFVIFFSESFKNILKRGYYKEFLAMALHAFFVTLCSVLYLFTVQEGEQYSRTVLYLTGAIYFILGYLARISWKTFLKKRKSSNKRKHSLIIVTNQKRAVLSIKALKNITQNDYQIMGLIISDEDMAGTAILGIPVIGGFDCLTEYACHQWVDEVFVNLPDDRVFTSTAGKDLLEMGIAIHYKVTNNYQENKWEQTVEPFGGYVVLTISANMVSVRQAFAKRLMDILGGLAGCFLTCILFLLIAPAIYIKSPGPVLFTQTRVGKNGRQFRIYKFRSMYMDAEERKKELMEKNRVKDGRMFKLDNDPRIIGSEKGPGKGIGYFIRKYSLDEFPQFFNVLKGDMSLVGTRPPTVDEWENYELHHRARMSIKPGLTGLWQVSGRSKITDFEEVVNLDTQYISNWSVGLDLKILLKTIGVVLKQDGAM